MRKRSAVAQEAEIGASVRIEGVFHDEIPTQFGHFQPFRATLHRLAECGEEPDFAALEPHELVRAIGGAVASEHVEIAAVFPVRRIFQPEGDDIVEEGGFVEFPETGNLCFVHGISALVF